MLVAVRHEEADQRAIEDCNCKVDWQEVASRLEGRNNKDCRKRYVYSLAPSIRKGPWSEYEDEALRAAVRRVGIR